MARKWCCTWVLTAAVLPALLMVGCACPRLASEQVSERVVSQVSERGWSRETVVVRDTVVLGVETMCTSSVQGFRYQVSGEESGESEVSGIRSQVSGNVPLSTFHSELSTIEGAVPLYRSHYETRVLRDTVAVERTDTIVQVSREVVRERYVPGFYRWCVGVLAGMVVLAAGYVCWRIWR